jgi:hypothetical protein
MVDEKQIYGEPHLGDTKFVAKCRALQSAYRVERGEPIRPYVVGEKSYYFGNYIARGEESGVNFLEDYIYLYARYRVAYKKPFETINSDRLFNNLLSSQPMAFNLFCPLRKMLCESVDVATRVIQSALPGFDIERVTDVDLEFIPDNYLELTGDRTAMDAIIRFVDSNGRNSFIAIETKYSENLGSNEAASRDTSMRLIKELSCFSPEAEAKIEASQIKLTQIYRNFLLSESYGRSVGAESYSVIMSPKDHPSTKREWRSVVDELAPEQRYKLQIISLEEFVERLISCSPTEYKGVFVKFYDRYLRLLTNDKL